MDQVVASGSDALIEPPSEVRVAAYPPAESSNLYILDHSVAAQCDASAAVFNHQSTATAQRPSSRLMDVTLATLLLILTLPLMMFCALAVVCSGRGPVLFSQRRIGKYGKEFNCLKFRTMVPGAELAIPSILQSSASVVAEWTASQKLRDDPRVTFVGRVLRRYCLDELPQLVNVLAGHMSIVGPRPIIAAEVVRYGPYFADYCSVRPGLTGLWQVSDRHAISYEDRVRLDATYAKSKSVRTDLRIIWRTVPIVLGGKNV